MFLYLLNKYPILIIKIINLNLRQQKNFQLIKKLIKLISYIFNCNKNLLEPAFTNTYLLWLIPKNL